MCFAYGPYASSILSNPLMEPNTENHGVYACAGITRALGSMFNTKSATCIGVKPMIGLPSLMRLHPCRVISLLILPAEAMDGTQISVCTRLPFPPWV